MDFFATLSVRRNSEELDQFAGLTVLRISEMMEHFASSLSPMVEVWEVSVEEMIRRNGVSCGIQNAVKDSTLLHAVFVHPNVQRV